MVQIAPSILNSDLLHLEDEVNKIQTADWVHFDVMDGHFVPNLTFGPMFVTAIKSVAKLPVEAHLMVTEPERFLDSYIAAGSRRIIVHAEATVHSHRLIQSIKDSGCRAGVALNPATPLSYLDYILPDLDLVLLMTVNPGFGGQKLIPAVIEKIKRLKTIRDAQNPTCQIEVDGGVNWENAATLAEAGVDILVAGTLIFKNPDPYKAVVDLKELVNKGGHSPVVSTY